MRLIDADKLEMALNEKLDSEAALMAFIKYVLSFKTVKCEDCRFFSTANYERRGYGMCHKTKQLMYVDEICNIGERRETDE